MVEAVPHASATRRGLHRTVAGGLAAAAVAPLFLAEDAVAAPGAGVPQRKGKWHRCKVHRKHTCWKARTCKHRRHKPPKDVPDDNPPPSSPPTPPEPHTELPVAAALHLASRFTYGVTPALHLEMESYGSRAAWFAAQLQPSSIADPVADGLQSWWPSLDLDAATIWKRDQDKVEATWVAMSNYQRWCLLRRIYSKRQVLEVMTEFFENHLHVPVQDDGVFGFRAAYGKLIRSHALGRFDQMLVAAITHPAMGTSLDNASSTKSAPNENLGRELLELHTVGRGNHTEDDVKNSARILTGYRVDMWRTWNAWYDLPSHWTGAVNVLGFSHSNTAADGRPVAEAYLTYLAHHPATARRLANKLAVRFVSDSPSEALVQHLADVYLANQTAIVPVLRALVAHPEFGGSRRRQGPHPDRRHRGHLPRPRRDRRAGRSTATPRPTRCSTRPRTSARRRSAGPGPTGSPRPAAPGRRPHGSSRPSRPTTRCAAAGGRRRTRPTTRTRTGSR